MQPQARRNEEVAAPYVVSLTGVLPRKLHETVDRAVLWCSLTIRQVSASADSKGRKGLEIHPQLLATADEVIE
jgi:hypothetical protein